jgi:hypothetical protein
MSAVQIQHHLNAPDVSSSSSTATLDETSKAIAKQVDPIATKVVKDMLLATHNGIRQIQVVDAQNVEATPTIIKLELIARQYGSTFIVLVNPQRNQVWRHFWDSQFQTDPVWRYSILVKIDCDTGIMLNGKFLPRWDERSQRYSMNGHYSDDYACACFIRGFNDCVLPLYPDCTITIGSNDVKLINGFEIRQLNGWTYAFKIEDTHSHIRDQIEYRLDSIAHATRDLRQSNPWVLSLNDKVTVPKYLNKDIGGCTHIFRYDSNVDTSSEKKVEHPWMIYSGNVDEEMIDVSSSASGHYQLAPTSSSNGTLLQEVTSGRHLFVTSASNSGRYQLSYSAFSGNTLSPSAFGDHQITRSAFGGFTIALCA